MTVHRTDHNYHRGKWMTSERNEFSRFCCPRYGGKLRSSSMFYLAKTESCRLSLLVFTYLGEI